MLGIIIGSASLVATMAVSDGIMAFARGQIQQQTAVQVISIGSRTSDYRKGRWVPITDYPIFTLADVESARRGVDGVAGVTMLLSGSAPTRFRGVEHQVSLTLGTADLPRFAIIEIVAGRFFSAIEASHNAPVVVVNYALARELAPGRDPLEMVGQEIQVRGRVRRIVGILTRSKFEPREIGIRKAVGARGADIQQQFLSESVAIAVVGTAIGLVLGLLLAAGVTAGFRSFVEAPVYPVLSFATVLLAIASSSAVGLIFGTVPARRAANLPVIAAIAHE